MRTPNSIQPPPPPHTRSKPGAPPEAEDSTAGGALFLVSLVAGIASIMLGTMSLVFWFSFSEWIVLSMPLALLAVVVANVVLAVWWFLGSIDIRIHIIGLTLGVVGVLGWFVRSGEIQKIVADVRTIAQPERAQQPKQLAEEQPEEQEKDNQKQAEVMQEKPKATAKSVPTADEEFEIAASQKGDAARVKAAMLIDLRNESKFSWERLESDVDFQMREVKAEFLRWKKDRIEAGDRYK